MTENALKCWYNDGCVAIGYKVDENKYYQVDDLVAPFIVDAFNMYVNGTSTKEIVEYLNNSGIKTNAGKHITKTTVSTLLQNRKYIGEYKYRDIVVPNGIPTIVYEELFDLAQKRLDKNRRTPAAMKAPETYILSSKVFCVQCGAPMVGESGVSKAKGGTVYHYCKCSNAKKRKCMCKAIPRTQFEKDIITHTVKDVLTDAVLDKITDNVYEYQKEDNKAIPLLQEQLPDCEKKIGNFIKAIENCIITDSTQQSLSELEVMKKDIESKTSQESIRSVILTKEQIRFFLDKMRTLDIQSDDTGQLVADTFINSIYVYEDKYIINYNCDAYQERIYPDIQNTVCSDLSEKRDPYGN